MVAISAPQGEIQSDADGKKNSFIVAPELRTTPTRRSHSDLVEELDFSLF
jgi:hypothetical protein